MNKVILCGRTCGDWKTRKYGDNKSFVTNSLAISEGKDKTEFVSVTAFGKTAEILYKYVKKKILDDEAGRKALWERLQFSLDGEPDPWFDFEEAAVDTRQFDAIGA